ncbi:hypothetical protein LCGC14_0321150 [marine sediment metagenome]|uniref:Response regulatory domain-containing protein n=1 Tax=marine sediment metagenome TaxID=412755 RepID=A0A0F9WRB7_9ZZZZ
MSWLAQPADPAAELAMRKLLILKGPRLETEGLVSLLQSEFDIQMVDGLDEALAAMRDAGADAVLAETADFLALERGIVTQQAAVVLDQIGDGVCLTAPDGQMVWANRRLRDLSGHMLDELAGLCAQASREFSAASQGGAERGKHYSLTSADGLCNDVVCSPVRDERGALRYISAVVINTTQQRQQQLKINAIDQAGRELVRLDDEAISQKNAQQRLDLLEDRIIRFSRGVLNYHHWALFVLSPKTNQLGIIIAEGLDETASAYRIFASTEGNGITGYVAATGRSYICPDTSADPRYLLSLTGSGSSLTVPLRMHDRVIGVLHVESDETNAFNDDDRQFAEMFANYVAMALNLLNLLVSERYTVHRQVSETMSAQLSGPINDVISEMGELMEDYLGNDELHERLGGIVEQATRVQTSLRQWADGAGGGILPSDSDGQRVDPLLANKRILVAEDDETIRRTLHDVLIVCGCEVAVASDGAEAKQRVSRDRFDLVISDVEMPGATGYDVFAATKAAHPSTPVILVTAFGYDPSHSIVKANREGLSAVLMKPFKIDDLLNQVRQALAR